MTSLPPLDALSAALKALLGEDAEVLSRRPNAQTSTFPSEIVTCRIGGDGGEAARLFCKYADGGVGLVAGHRSGVEFEASVYRELLSTLDVPSVRFYGSYRAPDTGATCFFLQALDETARVNKAPDPRAMSRAARWAGRFHALGERLAADFQDRLHHYDAAYYRSWPDETLRFAQDREVEFPGLGAVCERFARLLPRLLDRPRTIIHGEFYPRNILVEGETVYPVDWESAAVACGEIDLASLTENWPERTVRECVDAYCDARWGGRTPADFARTLDLARAYLHLRWMGGAQGTLPKEDFDWRLGCLRELSARIGDDEDAGGHAE